MSTYDTTAQDSTELDDRTERALTEYMSVLEEGGDVFTVVGENGGTYRVDSREGRCTCPDHEHRGVTCKHRRRVAFATGERVVPAGVEVNGHLGEHVEGEVRYAATDGGVSTETDGVTELSGIGDSDPFVRCDRCGSTGDTVGEIDHHTDCPTTETSNTSAGDHERVPVSGGVLVYERRAVGKELVGFEGVTDWENVADALRARGHGTGAIHQLPELDE
jgi:hypothetical protein